MSAREEVVREMTHGHLYLDAEHASALLAAYRAEVLREAAALVEYWHGSAPDVFSPQDSATLLRHVANGGFPKDAAY